MKKFLQTTLGLFFALVIAKTDLNAQCANTSSFGSANVSSGGTYTISTCNYASEYSTISGIVAGQTYTVTMTAPAYITVHNTSNTGPVVANGGSPLVFTATATGSVYISWNTNAGCGTDATCHTTTIAGPAAPPPANDNCAGAVSVNATGTTCVPTTGTTSGATQSVAGCSGTANDDVWYSFVASSTSQTINVTAPSGFDPVVQVYSGSCASLTSLVCSDAGFPTGGAGSVTQTGLTVGQTYYYRVYDYYSTNPTNTTFTTCVTVPPTMPSCVGNSPPGETCATATPICDLDGYCGSTTGYVADYWAQLNTAFCGSIENNSFLTFVASSSSISFNVWVTSSTMGYGIQIFIFQSAGACSGAVTSYNCWNPGVANVGNATNITATGLTPGQTYYMMIDGNSGDICNYVIGANSGVNVPVTVTPSATSVCSGVGVALTASGGNGSYTWSPAGGLSATTGTTVTATNATVGTYTYTATSSTGNPLCPSSTTASATVTVTNCGCTTTASNNGPVCASGTFNLSTTNAGAGYTYSWAGPSGYSSSSQNPTGVTAPATAGAYVYTVTATSGTITCTSTTTVTVNPRPTITAPANISVCAGTSVAATSLTSTPAGATYAWTNSNTAIGLAASGTGNVPAFTATNATAAAITSTITITPTLGTCAGTPVSYTVTVNPQPTSTFTNSANQCLNTNSFTFTNTGSAFGTHSWTFPSGTPATSSATSPSGVTWAAAGTYTVTHTVTSGTCTATNTVQITVFPRPNGPGLTPANPTCGASNGSITVAAATGGTPVYQYNLNGGANTALTNYTALAAGTYTVNVTDANGCTNNSTVTLTNAAGPTAIATTTTTAHCGQSDGSITLGAVTGGVTVYTYSVTPVVGFSTNTSYTGMATGTHTITVKDGNNCTYTTTVNVPNAAGPTGPNATPANSTCGASNGSVTLAPPTTGTGPFTYSFNGGATSATTAYTGLAANTYTYVTTDAFGCTVNGTVTVNNTAGPTAVVLTPSNASCGANNGSFTIGAVTGGTSAYTYSVSPGPAGFNPTTSFTGLAAGTYTVIVKDASGCTFTTNTTINNAGGPTAVVLTPTNSNCGSSNGSFTIGAVTGGVAAFTYSVSPGPAGFNPTTSFTGLAAGTYTVVVKDANGCTFTSNTTINNNAGPTAVILTPTNATCGNSNGSFTIGAVTGGGGTNTYSVSPGPAGFNPTTSFTGLAPNTYTVIVKDVNGCTFTSNTTISNTPGPTAVVLTPVNSTCGNSNGSFTIGAVTGGTGVMTYSVAPGPAGFTSTTNYTNLAAGTYTVTVKDANGCTFVANTTINNTAGPTAVTLTPVNTSCGGATGTLTIGAVTGGTSAYTYSVSPGPAGFNSTTSFTGLTAATYTVIVNDANNCQFTSTAVVGNNPGPTAVTLTPANSTCGASNGSVTIGAVTGGTAAYTYSFNGSGFTSTTSYTGLTAGTYTVIVQDANNCQFTQTSTVNNSGGPTGVVLTPVDATCGASNGSFTIGAVTGGVSAYTYSVNGGAFSGTTSYTGLAAGTYTVIVKDANNCTYTTTTAISNSGGPTAQAMSSTNSACSSNTGTVTFGATTGGTGIMTYSFNGGAFSGTTLYTNVAAGTYNATVQDGNGCQFSTTVTVGTVAGPTDVVLTPGNSTCGASNGTVAVGAVTGGTSAYTYSFDGGALSATTNYTGLAAGTHTVLVRDANGCTYSETVAVTNTPGPTAFAVSSTSSTCGNSNGTATAGAVTTSGSTTFQYSINGGALGATTTFSGLAAATYTLLVQDANGCQLTNTVTVTNLAGPTAQVLTPTNATCGNANGTVTIGATTGGNGAITYSFNGGAFSGTTVYSSLAAGTYTVIAQDANNCQFTQTTVVSNLAGPTALALTSGNASCGAANGTVTIGAVTGGAGSNTFSFNGGPFNGTTSYSGLTAATYTVVVQDANGCQFTQTVAVNNSGGPTAAVVTPANSTCGNSNGSITIGAVTGGTGAITYSINGGAFSGTTSYTGLAAGTYTVDVKDANGCTFTQTTIITNTPGPTAVALTPVNSTCGNANGSFTIGAVTGGTSGYTYSVNAGAFSGTTSYTNLLAGTYTVVVNDANNCQFTQTVAVANTAGPTAVALTPTNSTCGNNNGQVTVGVVTTTGSTTFQYSIDAGALQAGTSFTGLSAATHTVLVVDGNGCQNTTTVNVADTPGPTAQAVTTTNSTCGNANGIISIGATTGGTLAYQYSLNGAAFSAATSYTVAAGTHTITVQDANLCTYSVTATVNNTAGPTAVALSSTGSNCGNANGSVTVGVVTGGTSTYQYSINGGALQASTIFPNLLAGTYTVLVSDANSCTITNTVTVVNLGSPTAIVSSQTNVTCNGGNNGSATVTASGGAGTFTYTLNTGQTNGTGVFNNLVAGSYTTTVTDLAGCTTTTTFTIGQPALLVGSILNQTPTSCFGGSNGTVTITEVGGTSPFEYSINGGAFGASSTFSGLSANGYTVAVRDVNGCLSNVSVTITQPTLITLTMSSTNANCTASNGTATVVASGGTPGYLYSWTGGGGSAATTAPVPTGNYTVTVTDLNACTQTGSVLVDVTMGGTASFSNVGHVSCAGGTNGTLSVSVTGSSTAPFTYSWSPNVGTTATVTGLPVGNYNVMVTDVNGCVSIASTVITEPIPLGLSFTSTNVSCNGGSDGAVNATVTGGRPPYAYNWSPGAFNTANISGLPIGTYSLTVTDDNGCIITGTRTITEPTALTITPTINNPHCNQADGSATVVGSGGAGGYQFSLNGGAFGAGSFTGLTATAYTVTIKDANNCTANLPLLLVDQSGPTATITASTNVSCNGGTNGSATVSASGGTTPYLYAWNPSSQTTQTANNLSAGVYGVQVTDANGCIASAAVTITQPGVLQINASGTDPVCTGQLNGTGSAAAFGGTTPYSFQWAVLPIQNTANATGLAAGTHAVTVTDANGCTANTSITLTDPALLTATTTRVNLLCNAVCNGSATAVTSNGNAPFAYLWNDPNAQTTQTASGLCAGTYTVNITDFKGCTTSAVVTITEPPVLTSSIINPVNVTCAGLCNGSGEISLAGGTPPYSYSWSNSTTTSTNTALCVGTYTGTVTDANGCPSSSVLNITAPNPIVLTASSTNASCYNVCDGTATAALSGGTAPYTFLWQPSLSQVINPTALCDGTHTVTVTDANGCSMSATTVITEPSQLNATTIVNGNNFCGQSNGSAQVQVSGGTSPFTYLWSNGPTSALNSNLPGGVYTVDVTDGNGCTVNAVANVNDIPAPTLVLSSYTDITCYGLNNGTAVISIAGGTTPYSSQTWLLPITLISNPDQSGNGLWPGNNVYSVVDAAGCISSITVPILEPTQLVSATNALSHVTCNGFNDGTVTMLMNGGTSPYTYQWTDAAAQTTATAQNLVAGTYICNGTDANGCQTSQTVTINEPLPLVVSLNSITQINCYGNANGTISVTTSGGTPAYSYAWTPSVGTGSSITNLQPGNYQLTLTDSKGCTTNYSNTITQPDSFTVVINTVPSTCSDPNASISLFVSGATAPYNYQWNDPALQTTSSALNLVGGPTYNCVITDANGCTKNISQFTSDLPAPIISNIAITNVTCYGGTDGTLTATAQSGGSSSYTYAWYNSSNVLVGNGSFQGGLPIGTYQIIVTDANGCTVNDDATITQPFPLNITVSQNQIACNGQVLGVYASAGNGTPPYSYTWTGAGAGLNGGGNHNVTFTNNNQTSIIQSYSVSASDANGCPAVSGSFNVTVLPKITPVVTDVTGCVGETVDMQASAYGGDGAPYTFTWATQPIVTTTGSSSTATVPVTGLNPMSYVLTVDDGCSTSEQAIVNVSGNPKPAASLIGINTEGCSDLTVAFSGSGGVGFSGCTYDWTFGDGTTATDSTTTHTFVNNNLSIDSVDVQLIVTTTLGCSDTLLLNNYVVVYPKPVAEFTYTPGNPTESSPQVNFFDQSLLASSYSWNFGEFTSMVNTSSDINPEHSYQNSGTYTVTLAIASAMGCKDTVTHELYIEPEFAIYVPNAFTPNSDVKNEVFIPQGIGISEERYHMYIYDRWGELIFESNSLNVGWDGTAKGKTTTVQQDVYIWKILAYDLNNNKHSLTGHVTVVR